MLNVDRVWYPQIDFEWVKKGYHTDTLQQSYA